MSGEEPRLPCGRPVLALVQQTTDGTPPEEPGHQEGCPHCQAALARFLPLTAQLEALAAEPVQAPPGLRGRVLEQIRRENGRDWFTVGDGAEGRDRAANEVVGQVAWRAIVATEGVHLASVTIEPLPGEDVHVVAHVTAALGVPLPALSDQLRETVVAHVWTLLRLRVRRVDVHVDEIS